MALITLDLDQDMAESTVETKLPFQLTTLSGAQDNATNVFVVEATATGYLSNAQGVATTTPLSSAFRHISNYFFSSTLPNAIPVSNDTSSTTGVGRVLQVGSRVADDGLASGSITAIVAFGTTTNNTYIDVAETSVTSSIGLKGAMVSQSDTSNIVGTVFYDQATIILHGGSTYPTFLIDSTSGFEFGAASADKVVVTQLSFQARNILKRTTFFCRAFNKQFNYTNNPTSLADQTLGTITASLTANPATYITTIGLYDDDGEMLAIAKVAPPIRKNFSSEVTLGAQIQY